MKTEFQPRLDARLDQWRNGLKPGEELYAGIEGMQTAFELQLRKIDDRLRARFDQLGGFAIGYQIQILFEGLVFYQLKTELQVIDSAQGMSPLGTTLQDLLQEFIAFFDSIPV